MSKTRHYKTNARARTVTCTSVIVKQTLSNPSLFQPSMVYYFLNEGGLSSGDMSHTIRQPQGILLSETALKHETVFYQESNLLGCIFMSSER